MTFDDLSLYELPPALVRPALAACRLFNTAIDSGFYDVPKLISDLRARHEDVDTLEARGVASAAQHLDLSALANPEGSLLVIDAADAPYIRRFDTLDAFLDCQERAVAGVSVATISGVGSSALGGAALGWNVSEALGRPVVAIVAGYGVADAWQQALGAIFGFGLHDFLNSKSWLQTSIGAVAPRTAAIGRRLSATAPGSVALANGAPTFRTGSGSSDVLHALARARKLTAVVGHSKGALVIANALRSLSPERTHAMDIITLGLPIAEELNARYHQFLGLFDAIGQANTWGNRPDHWIPTDHSTNTALPLSMSAEALVQES